MKTLNTQAVIANLAALHQGINETLNYLQDYPGDVEGDTYQELIKARQHLARAKRLIERNQRDCNTTPKRQKSIKDKITALEIKADETFKMMKQTVSFEEKLEIMDKYNKILHQLEAKKKTLERSIKGSSAGVDYQTPYN